MSKGCGWVVEREDGTYRGDRTRGDEVRGVNAAAEATRAEKVMRDARILTECSAAVS